MVDSLDVQLIELLGQDANIRSAKLAKQLGVSSSTIRRRVRHLIKGKAVKIVAIPTPEAINLPLRVIVAFQVAQDKIGSIFKQIFNSYENVRFMAATSGRFDLMAIMWFESTNALYDYIGQKVSRIEGIKSTETFICLHVERSRD